MAKIKKNSHNHIKYWWECGATRTFIIDSMNIK